jgi:hypothetical protein
VAARRTEIGIRMALGAAGPHRVQDDRRPDTAPAGARRGRRLAARGAPAASTRRDR